MAFAFDPEAIADAREHEVESYCVPDFDGLSDVVVAYPENELQLIGDTDLRRTYTDALIDLHRLVDEYRFEALLALTLLRDYVIKRDRGEAPVVTLGPNTLLDTLPMAAEVVVVLKRYAVEPPSADELFNNPHQQIAGARMLSRWFAGQMIDSAVYRGIAACDRLAILLRCQAGLPIETRGDRRHQPAFTRDSLRKLDPTYRVVDVFASANASCATIEQVAQQRVHPQTSRPSAVTNDCVLNSVVSV